MSDKILPNPSALKSGDVVPPSSRQGSFRSCTWCAAKDAQIAALEAEVQRLNDIVIGFMGDGTESPDLAPFVALAKAASEYRRLSLCRNNYPNTYNEAWWKAGSNLVDALADPAIQRAVTEAG